MKTKAFWRYNGDDSIKLTFHLSNKAKQRENKNPDRSTFKLEKRNSKDREFMEQEGDAGGREHCITVIFQNINFIFVHFTSK